MTIARKFTAALLLCALLALLLEAFLSVHGETEHYEADVAAQMFVTARALRPPIVDIWRSDGEARALALVREADQRLQKIDIRWRWLDVDAPEEYRPRVPLAELEPVRRGEELSLKLPDVENGRVVTYTPVITPTGRPGAIEVSRTLRRVSEVRSAAIRRALTWAGIIAILSALTTSALGAWVVGRPIARLIEQARRIGGGDLSYRIETPHADEIGALAREMNRMCDSLAEAREATTREAAEKLRAIEQLRHADRLATVGRLAAGMAHELGTPLNVVSARAKPIATGAVAGDVARENARIIQSQVERMTALMRKLLDFARKRDLQRSPSDVTTLVRQTIALLTPLARERRVNVILGTDERIEANVDPVQLEQVLTNLLVNAVHASKDDGVVTVDVTERVSTPPADVGNRPLACVCVDVADEGSGIAADELGKVFEPFYTTKPPGEGTGLGLSIAYGIVRDHGGWIATRSEPGKGSVFSVCLPKDRLSG